jgi:ABC-type phosphate transport system auxiliary subunit
MVYNLTMSGFKSRAAVSSAVLSMAVLLAFLAIRGLSQHAPAPRPRLAWREADDTDLF